MHTSVATALSSLACQMVVVISRRMAVGSSRPNVAMGAQEVLVICWTSQATTTATLRLFRAADRASGPTCAAIRMKTVVGAGLHPDRHQSAANASGRGTMLARARFGARSRAPRLHLQAVTYPAGVHV
jgi:hypothetical protein